MLTSIKQRLDREDEGFTLIELMVVVLIIAILLAIAIPTFLGARGQANSRAAQSSLRNALTSEQTYYTNNQAFGDSAATPSITTIEQNLHWQTATQEAAASPMPQDPNTVYVTLGTVTSTNDTIVLQAFAKDGNCYSVYQTNGQSSSNATLYSVNKGACVSPTIATTPPTSQGTQASSHAGTTSAAPGATSWYSTW